MGEKLVLLRRTIERTSQMIIRPTCNISYHGISMVLFYNDYNNKIMGNPEVSVK